jgi:hypothetical protein
VHRAKSGANRGNPQGAIFQQVEGIECVVGIGDAPEEERIAQGAGGDQVKTVGRFDGDDGLNG